MVGQNLSLKLEVQGDNEFNEVHSSRGINWITPKKRQDLHAETMQ